MYENICLFIEETVNERLRNTAMVWELEECLLIVGTLDLQSKNDANKQKQSRQTSSTFSEDRTLTVFCVMIGDGKMRLSDQEM